MKKSASEKGRHSGEFKGVVKKMTGTLTSDRNLEEEGLREMLGSEEGSREKPKRRGPVPKGSREQLNSDPYRRG